MKNEISIEGIVENIVYYNNLNGYCVFSIIFQGESKTEEVLCVGNVPTVSVGENIKVFGNYVVHPVYGKQLSVAHFEKTLPSSESGLLKYLSSGCIKGVREKMAVKIVDKFGKDTLMVLENYPEKLTEIKGISHEKAMSISSIFHEQAEMRRIIIFFQEYNISPISARKIYKKYKENTIDIIKTNPYKLADDIFGIGFKIADNIAFKIGFERDSVYRIQAGIKYALTKASNDGHTFLPKAILTEKSSELLDVSLENIEQNLIQLQMERAIWQEKINDEIAIYLNGFFYAESFVAKKLLELSGSVVKKGENMVERIQEFENETGVILAEEQRLAVIEALDNGVLVITGGPGTGKTTTLNVIINILKQDGYEIELAAPTGRAAKRMSEACNMEAKTLHRLLEISFSEGETRFQTVGKDRDNPIETDVIIVDESSMVDILLMNNLLSAIAPGTRVILVGDVDQLPSVGPGNVLKDIINSRCLKTVRLTEIFRQAQESAIVMNAHRINHGEYPILNEKDKDFFFIKKSSISDVTDTIIDLITKRIPKFKGCSIIEDIQILTPMRKSLLGVLELNKILQEKLNPPDKFKNEKILQNMIFRQGDKVMQIKNNYNMPWKIFDEYGKIMEEGLGIFNGDTGIIKSINDYDEMVLVLFDDKKQVEYDFTQIDELNLSYAITIHKSQGSEYPIVIIPIHSGAQVLMSRNLLYTAVTRAKDLVIIVGIPDTLYRMIDNNKELFRYTSLDKRIMKISQVMNL